RSCDMTEHTSPDRPRRIVVTGATGNVGVAVVERLLEDADVAEVVGLARRAPDWTADRLTWRELDLAESEAASRTLGEVMRHADAVVHLAWAFQPTHQPEVTWRINAVGSRLVADAAVDAGVGVFVHQS